LETGVIWSASNINLIKRLDLDDNYINIPIKKDAADQKAAASSLVPKDPIKDPEDLETEINDNDFPKYTGFKNKILEGKEDQFKNAGMKELKKPKKNLNKTQKGV
jgi:hypothetical protein